VIDILLSTYNGEKYLMQQIQSFFDQTYTNWRLIIRDDGSTDQTLVILNKLAENYKDKIILHRGKNIGTIKSYEWLLTQSDAEYTMFSDHDDIWMDTKIEVTFLKMNELESKFTEIPLLVFTNLRVVNENLELVNESFWKYSKLDVKLCSDFNYLGVCNCVNACTIMINSKARSLCLPFSDKTKMHDSWIALKVCKNGVIDYVDKPTILYRQHSENVFGAAKEKINTISSYLMSRVKSLNMVINGNRLQFELLRELNYGNIFKYLYYKISYLVKARLI